MGLWLEAGQHLCSLWRSGTRSMGLWLEAGQHLCSLWRNWTCLMGLSRHCNLFEAFGVYRTSRPGCLHASWNQAFILQL